MDPNRRNFLTMIGLGAIAMAGCNSMSNSGYRYVSSSTGTAPKADPNASEGGDPTYVHKPYHWDRPTSLTPAATVSIDDSILDKAIGREVWADAAPLVERLRPMQTPYRITLHHAGELSEETTRDEVIEKLRIFRRDHLKRLDAGDIGYHYMIDRQGNLWHGRDLKYQGAHVKDQNEGNIGVMVMGNFEDQDPTRAQLDTANKVLPALMKRYGIEMVHVQSHGEMAKTLCPGRILQAHFSVMRDRKFA